MAAPAPDLIPPRYVRSGRTRSNAEKWSWILMRASGVVLIALIFTHLFVNLLTGDGVNQIDFAFVAGKWASPLWQWWDLTMLVLAMLHGGNGMRLLINDYARTTWLRKTLKVALASTVSVIVVLGTLVIFTFEPCPEGYYPPDVPQFCLDIER